ncbi:hypothetical protein [Paracoccus spongiarum]|uniref:Transposase TnpC homeodomain domain-containing protein n=1 Tax=Paracoccus spongiarum TaxID=3064387 RepID=A0ABT9JC77_9RHOB|nr:hypothetical protein [Paracoccus sp. 2205BS29-5]MDP5307394.1 hypothetical protein [Paracoccus sp. 2205BS29-5]
MDADALSRANAGLKARLAEVQAALMEVLEADRRLEGILPAARCERFGKRSETLSPDHCALPLADADLAPRRPGGRTGAGRRRAAPDARGRTAQARTQPLLVVDVEQALVVHHMLLTPRMQVQPTATEARCRDAAR